MLVFKPIAECADIIATEDERFYINLSETEVAITKADLSKQDLINAFDKFENIIRHGVVDALCTPVSELQREPINHWGAGHTGESNMNGILAHAVTEHKSKTQLTYLRELKGVYRDWLILEGIMPQVTNSSGKCTYPQSPDKLRHGYTLTGLIQGLSQADMKRMLSDIIITKRCAIDKTIRKHPKFDLAGVKSQIELLNDDEEIARCLNKINGNVFKKRASVKYGLSYTTLEKTWCLFLQFCSQMFWKLPALQYAKVGGSIWRYLSLPKFNYALCEVFLPRERLEEVQYAIEWVATQYKTARSTRSVTPRDVFYLFACSNYATSKGFDIDALDLVKGGIGGKTKNSSIPPYIRAMTNFYKLNDADKREVEKRISVRAGATKIQEDPFVLFKLERGVAETYLKAQVNTFKKKHRTSTSREVSSLF